MSENLYNGLLGLQIALVVALVISVLLQNRAEGLGKVFGGGGEVFRTKRGMEKFLYYFTIFLAAAFGTLSFVLVKYGA